MLKISPNLVGTLPVTSINNSEVIDSRVKKNRKSAKSDFTKPIHRVEKPSLPTFNAKQLFTQLK